MKLQKESGQLAENFACRYLQKKGLTLITRNYRSPFGEIDLIMHQSRYLIFVEVRLRNPPFLVSGKESVSYFKQQRLIKTAHHFLTRHKPLPFCRFDVMDLQNDHGQFKVEWVRNAFELS